MNQNAIRQPWYAPEGLYLETAEDPELPSDVKRKPYVTASETGTLSGSGATSTMEAGPGARASLYARYPPHQFPPFDATLYDLPNFRIPFALGAGATAALVTWPRVPLGQRGVIRKIGGLVIAGLLADVTWSTRINGSPVLPFLAVVGAFGTLEAPQDTQIILNAGDIFSLFVVNTGAAVTVNCRTWGWIWTDERA
jgi:hypothetical protein